MRSLAQRSAASAKEIKELISNTRLPRVDSGAELAERAGQTMAEVTSVAIQSRDGLDERDFRGVAGNSTGIEA